MAVYDNEKSPARGCIPAHVGIIMDGNGRWAKSRFMPRSYGHLKGMERMIGLLEHLSLIHI